MLRDEVGLEPSAETTELERRIIDNDSTLTTSDTPPTTTPTLPRGAFAAATRFVGRDHDLAGLADLLARVPSGHAHGPGRSREDAPRAPTGRRRVGARRSGVRRR